MRHDDRPRRREPRGRRPSLPGRPAGLALAALAALAALLATALIAPRLAHAQIGGNEDGAADAVGYRLGHQYGRQDGRIDGSRQGRDQLAVRSFVEAFADALESIDPRSAGVARETARERGRRDGETDGDRTGRRAATARVAELFATRGDAPPAPEPPPEAAGDITLPPGLDVCHPPPPLHVRLLSGEEVTFDIAELPDGKTPMSMELPEAPYPKLNSLRSRARIYGYTTADAIDLWAYAYQRGFRDGYRDEYHLARDAVAADRLLRYRQQGAQAGQLEGLRRIACSVVAEGYRQAFRAARTRARENGWAAGWSVARERLQSGPFIALDEVALVDASGDAVFEPGEEVFLAAQLTNLGRQGSTESAGAWRARRGLEGSGELGTTPRPGESDRRTIPLGRIPEDARPLTSIVVEVAPLGAAPEHAVAKIGRPVVIETVAADLAPVDGRLGAVARVVLHSLASAPGSAPLVLEASSRVTTVPPLAAGETRSVEVGIPLSAGAAAQAGTTIELSLGHVPGSAWQRWTLALDVGVRELVAVVPRLDDPSAALEALRERLADECRRSTDDHDALQRDDTELAAYVEALDRLPPSARQLLVTEVSAGLLALVEGNEFPRKTRRAVRNALDG